MTWQQLATIQTSTDWLLTESVSGSVFRITHNVSGTNIQSLRSVIAQAFDEGVNNTYFDFRRLAYKPESEAFLFIQPPGLLNRKLAIKRLDNLANAWTIQIEVLDGMPESISLPIAINEVEGLDAALNDKARAESLNIHVVDIDNPHNVTTAQIGAEPAGTGTAAAAEMIRIHLSDEDPHPQYATDATVTLVQSAVDSKETVGAAANAIASHLAAADPHSQYATDTQISQLHIAIGGKQSQAANLDLLASLTEYGVVQRVNDSEIGAYFTVVNAIIPDSNGLISLSNIPLILPIGATIDYEGVIASNGILNENGLIWLLLDGGTIGNAASGATRYADAKAQSLFEKLWNNPNLAIFAANGSTTTKGASASADFAASKRLALPDIIGRTIIPAGTSAPLTTRVWGTKGGAETHNLTLAQIPSHVHIQTLGGALTNYTPAGGGTGIGGTANTSTTQSTGGGTAHNNMPPYYVSAGKLILAGKS